MLSEQAFFLFLRPKSTKVTNSSIRPTGGSWRGFSGVNRRFAGVRHESKGMKPQGGWNCGEVLLSDEEQWAFTFCKVFV